MPELKIKKSDGTFDTISSTFPVSVPIQLSQVPSSGIPRSDLANDVQASLDNADGAVQTAQGVSSAGRILTVGNDGNVFAKNDKFELIETITLTEDVASITRNAEPDNTPYSFSEIMLLFTFPEGGGGAAQLSGTYYSSTTSSYFFVGNFSNYRYARAGCMLHHGILTPYTFVSSNYESAANSMGQRITTNLPLSNAITRFALSCNGFIAGTVIKILGVRA